MKYKTPAALLLCLSLTAHGQTPAARRPRNTQEPAAQAKKQPLPIRRVVLYSNGVAYFERRGNVSGHTEINLPFKQSQVDDVLKSMIVLDLGQGRIGTVSYNSSAPSASRLAEIPFSIDSGNGDEAGGLAAVLKQFQGSRVSISAGARSATGAILTVEEQKSQIDANKPAMVTRRIVLSSDGGELQSFDLSEIRSVTLLDEGARHDVAEFADVTAAARRHDAKTITVTSDGGASREMAVSYTVAAPIWKTTYRVVLDQSGKPYFQGWAIVDNIGDEDWSNVKLSLVSGTPVSFIQPIQQPMYRYRPVVPIPENLQLKPQVYEAAQVDADHAAAEFGGKTEIISTNRLSSIGTRSGGGMGTGEGSGMGPGRGFNTGGGQPASKAVGTPPPPPPAPKPLAEAVTSGESGVSAAATGGEVGDLFQYTIEQPISVAHDHSALIPILQTQMEGERVSIYNELARRDRPMGGMRLKNTSNLTLEGGALTIIDGDSYAGEALMDRLKPGEERFISFALDLGTLVSAQDKTTREPVFTVRIIRGVMETHYYSLQSKTYSIKNQTDKPRVVFVEHPVHPGWKLSDDTAKPYQQTASFYRFKVELGPNALVQLPVAERTELMDQYGLSNLTRDDVSVFVSRRYIDDQTRAALEQILNLKDKIAQVTDHIGRLDKENAEIAADQARLRENIKALKDTGEARQLIARYVEKASAQETRIEQITTEIKAAYQEREKLQNELDAAIRGMTLDRKL